MQILTADPPVPGPPGDASHADPERRERPPRRSPSAASQIESLGHLEERSDPRVALLRSDADLIVVGPRGSGVLKMLHLGSTAGFLLQRPPTPLVIARALTRAERVLVCADGSSHSALAVEALATMPWIDASGVVVLGVDDDRSAVSRGVEQSLERLRGVAAEVTERRVLIVMGTRGTLGLRRLVVGSTASAVTRAAECAVLVACADDS